VKSVGFVYARSHRLFCNLTDMCRKPSACFGLCMGMVPKAYHPPHVRGHPPVSLPLLSSPTLPLSICISPTPLYYLQGPYPQSQRLWYSKSDDSPDVDSPQVVDILYPPPLAPQQHQTSIGYMGAHLCDTTVPSTSRELMVMGGLEAWCCTGHYIYVL
jgi:hypothetical protein